MIIEILVAKDIPIIPILLARYILNEPFTIIASKPFIIGDLVSWKAYNAFAYKILIAWKIKPIAYPISK